MARDERRQRGRVHPIGPGHVRILPRRRTGGGEVLSVADHRDADAVAGQHGQRAADSPGCHAAGCRARRRSPTRAPPAAGPPPVLGTTQPARRRPRRSPGAGRPPAGRRAVRPYPRRARRRRARRSVDRAGRGADRVQARPHAAVDRGVAGGDEVVERDRPAGPQPAREVDVEVPEVADDHSVGRRQTPRAPPQAPPAVDESRAQPGHPPRVLQHLHARRGVQPERRVAHHHVVSGRDDALLDGPDPRVPAGVVGAEEQDPHRGRLHPRGIDLVPRLAQPHH